MWEQIEQETETRWQVESSKESWEGLEKVMVKHHGDVDTFNLRFVVRRL